MSVQYGEHRLHKLGASCWIGRSIGPDLYRSLGLPRHLSHGQPAVVRPSQLIHQVVGVESGGTVVFASPEAD